MESHRANPSTTLWGSTEIPQGRRTEERSSKGRQKGGVLGGMFPSNQLQGLWSAVSFPTMGPERSPGDLAIQNILLQMSMIQVALSHCCCRTTLYAQTTKAAHAVNFADIEFTSVKFLWGPSHDQYSIDLVINCSFQDTSANPSGMP